MFNITDQKGFHITFSNGNTVSVQWGYGNYCDHKYFGSFENRAEGCKNAEIMVWDINKNTLPIPNEKGEMPEEADVCGYMTPEHVAFVINFYSK